MKYAFYDNNKPATFKFHNVHHSWDNNVFDTFEECVAYANNWMGIYGPIPFELNKPFSYGYNTKVEIRSIEE